MTWVKLKDKYGTCLDATTIKRIALSEKSNGEAYFIDVSEDEFFTYTIRKHRNDDYQKLLLAVGINTK